MALTPKNPINPILAGGGYMPGSNMAQSSPYPRSEFRHFLEAEIDYHKNMASLYEWLLAQEKLGALPGQQGDMLRSIIMAGLHQMAAAYQPKEKG